MTEFDIQTIRAARAYHRDRERRRLVERETLRERVRSAAREAIERRAREIPAVRAVYLFGSVTREGQFGPGSDIDVAVDSSNPVAESRLWRALEEALGRPVDVRPLTGPLLVEALEQGECVYAREDAAAGTTDPG